jgi:hypothetical protein
MPNTFSEYLTQVIFKVHIDLTSVLHIMYSPKPSSMPAANPCIVADVPGGVTALAYATIVV